VLSVKEKRFIKYWEEQRTGGKFKYYLLYILAGTFVSTLTLMFLSVMLWGLPMMIIVSIASLVLATILTIMSWETNEKRFKEIIRREVHQGQLLDEKREDGTSV
jgi:Ca2+-dependent lipid-binding protein